MFLRVLASLVFLALAAACALLASQLLIGAVTSFMQRPLGAIFTGVWALAALLPMLYFGRRGWCILKGREALSAWDRWDGWSVKKEPIQPPENNARDVT